MHSRIFEIHTENPYRIKAKNHITADDLPDWFFASVADYAEDLSDDEFLEDLSWIKTITNGALSFQDNKFTLLPNGKENYFRKKHSEYCQIAEKLSKCSLESFSTSGIEFDEYELRQLYDDKFGFYAYVDSNLITFDEFMRSYVDDDKTYVIEGVIDYHS